MTNIDTLYLDMKHWEEHITSLVSFPIIHEVNLSCGNIAQTQNMDRLYNEPFHFKNVKVIIDKERQELSNIGGDKRDLTTKCNAGFWIGYRGRKIYVSENNWRKLNKFCTLGNNIAFRLISFDKWFVVMWDVNIKRNWVKDTWELYYFCNSSSKSKVITI